MKKLLFFILIALTSASFSSCSKDDDTQPSLEGTWYIYKETTIFRGETVHTEEMEGCDAESNFQILADNSVIYQNFLSCNGYTTMTGIYDADANQVVLTHEGEDYIFEIENDNGDLLLSTTYTVRQGDGEENETTIYHCRRGELASK